MRISDIPDFPPRATKALAAAGVETLEGASRYSREALLGLSGLAERSLELLEEAGWTPGTESFEAASPGEAAAEEAEEVFAATAPDMRKRADEAWKKAKDAEVDVELEVLRQMVAPEDHSLTDEDLLDDEDLGSFAKLCQDAYLGETKDRAETFFLELCKNAVPSPQLIAQAWELAIAFETEADRAAGAEIAVYDGLRVRFQGEDWTLRTAFKPNEAKPAGMKTIALVPASR